MKQKSRGRFLITMSEFRGNFWLCTHKSRLNALNISRSTSSVPQCDTAEKGWAVHLGCSRFLMLWINLGNPLPDKSINSFSYQRLSKRLVAGCTRVLLITIIHLHLRPYRGSIRKIICTIRELARNTSSSSSSALTTTGFDTQLFLMSEMPFTAVIAEWTAVWPPQSCLQANKLILTRLFLPFYPPQLDALILRPLIQ